MQSVGGTLRTPSATLRAVIPLCRTGQLLDGRLLPANPLNHTRKSSRREGLFSFSWTLPSGGRTSFRAERQPRLIGRRNGPRHAAGLRVRLGLRLQMLSLAVLSEPAPLRRKPWQPDAPRGRCFHRPISLERKDHQRGDRNIGVLLHAL
jgi:hypothetical protein